MHFPPAKVDPYGAWRLAEATCLEACAAFGWPGSRCYPIGRGRGWQIRVLSIDGPEDPRADWFRERGWEIDQDTLGWMAAKPAAG